MLLLVLLGDDAALLHESVLPALGISEHAVYAAYGLIVSAWIAVFRKEIFASEFALLALAAAAPASRSLALDVFSGSLTLEDYAKYLGIATLFAYTFREARRRLRPR